MNVYLIAMTKLTDGFHFAADNNNWQHETNQADSDLLAEFAGRLCYKSWRPSDGTDKTNANVTKVREGNAAYLANVISSGHGSVFEHASFTFLLEGCSRVLTHELVRHRAGMAYSQESLRYVRLTHLEIVLPKGECPPEALPVFERTQAYLRMAIAELNELLLKDDMPFKEKKRLTSLIRRIAPIGVKTNIVFSANIRALRHIINSRTSEGAEAEIQDAFREVKRICLLQAPNSFQLLAQFPKI